MKQIIQIKATELYNDELEYTVKVIKNDFSCVFSFYGDYKDLTNIAKEMQSWPLDLSHKAEFIKGSIEEDYLYYYKLEIFSYNNTGAIALKFTLNNKEDVPKNIKMEICIETHQMNLIDLGRKLENWEFENEKIFIYDCF